MRPSSSRLHAVWVCGCRAGRRAAHRTARAVSARLRSARIVWRSCRRRCRGPRATVHVPGRTRAFRSHVAVRFEMSHGPARGSHAVGRARASPGTERAVARARRRPGSGGRGEGGAGRRRVFVCRFPTDIHHTQSASGHRRTQPAVCRSGLGFGRYLPSICRQQVRPGAPRRHAIVYGPAVTRRASVRFSALGSARKDSRRTIIVKS